MKKAISILFLVVLFFSCNAHKKTVLAKPEMPIAKSLLWKISGNGLEKPSYLYGTIHLTCNYKLTNKLQQAFDQTDRLTLEIDIDDPTMQASMMKQIMMKEGQTLKSLLTEKEYQKLDSFFTKTMSIPIGVFNKMKPFALSSSLMTKMVDCTIPDSYEVQFIKISKAQNEEVLGLETLESQMQLFDTIPYRKQLDELLKMADEGLDKSKGKFEKMSVMYQQEDLEALLKLLLEEDGMEKDYKDILLDNRNLKWIPSITKIAKEKPTLFAVGAMHLPGKKGVINLLKKEGFTVEPVF